jgi:N-acetylglucosaminyl-diphospho-decaprenol L-rhamnosyltransferase
MSQEVKVTVAVVSWNTRELLSDCLTSLRVDADGGLVEVWVHDNASTDGSADLVRERFPWAKLIAARKNIGFGAGVNAIAERTSSDWLVPANADIQVSPGALDALLHAGDRHPEAAVLAPRLLLPGGSTQHSVYPFPTLPFALGYLSGATSLSRPLARHWCIDRGFEPDRERDVGWAVGAFLLVRRDAWEQVGGFDEAQWMYAEDLDLGWRLKRAGWTCRYVPEARVLHAESAATTRAWGDERHARWHAATYAWFERRRGRGYARLQAVVYVLGFLIRGAALWPVALAGGARARAAMLRAFGGASAHTVGLRPGTNSKLRG